MKTLLITGFGPFLHFKKNPTMEIIKELDGQVIGDWKIAGRIMEVDFNTSGDQVIGFYEEVKPDAVISLGLAGGRTHITPERIAINCNDGEKDNSGYAPSGEKIAEDGADGIFSTLPVSAMVRRLHEHGYPASISNSAGTYLCNHVMYRMLHHLQKECRSIPSGFIHIPASHDMAVDSRKLPSWSQADLNAAIRLCIEAL